MSTSTGNIYRALGVAYISGEGEENYWHEGDPVTVEVNREDPDSEYEIRIGILTEVGMSEDAGLYLSLSEAKKVMVGLGAAVAEAESRA